MNMNVLLLAETQGIQLSPVYLLAILAGAGSIIALLFKLLISTKDNLIAAKEREFSVLVAQKDKALADLDSVNKSYREIADEALKSAADTLAHYRQKEGKPPVVPLANVLPESHSPSTPEQRVTADVATMRQKLAQIKIAAGQAPREEPEKAGFSHVDKTGVSAGIIGVIKQQIDQVPDKTAQKVVEKIAEDKRADGE